MSDEEKPPTEVPKAVPNVVIHETVFPQGHNFPEDLLAQWISIPEDEPVVIGPLSRRAIDNLLDARWARCERDAQLLATFSYRGVLARGFALVRDRTGRPLRAAA